MIALESLHNEFDKDEILSDECKDLCDEAAFGSDSDDNEESCVGSQHCDESSKNIRNTPILTSASEALKGCFFLKNYCCELSHQHFIRIFIRFSFFIFSVFALYYHY